MILGLVALFAMTLGRQYLKRLNPQQAGSVTAVDDERVNRFLKDGTKLLEEGDVEGAKEQFVKAQALADKSPRVLAALARLETVRADITWLWLRLLDPQSTDLVQSTHRDLGRRVGKAREAAEAAFKVDPEALPVVRARVDALSPERRVRSRVGRAALGQAARSRERLRARGARSGRADARFRERHQALRARRRLDSRSACAAEPR